MSATAIVVGAGVIGASIAFHLSDLGVAVTVLDQSTPGTGASGNSFGWINSNYAETADYHRLRCDGIAASRVLSDRLDLAHCIRWNGSLCWEEDIDALRAQVATFETLGYPARLIDAGEIAALEPALSQPPDHALYAPQEGAADTNALTRALLTAATQRGAHVVTGCKVTHVLHQSGQAVGVETTLGQMHADTVILATGEHSTGLLRDVDVTLPVEVMTGVILRTNPAPPVIRHILLARDVHTHQLPDGSLLVGEIFSGGAPDALNRDGPAAFGDEMMRRLCAMLPDLRDTGVAHVQIGRRPVPPDGLPAVGAIPSVPNLYVAVMHSGVTLAACVGQALAQEITTHSALSTLAGFRPDRF